MSRQISRRALLAGMLAAGAAGPGFALAPETSLRPRLRPVGVSGSGAADAGDLIRKANLKGAVGFAVADMNSGAVLESVDGARGLPPASVAKTVTALYALDVLGAAHRFETRLIAAGPVRDGILTGDLILAGGGDPTLDTEALAQMAAALKAAGLRELRGRFLVHDGALPFVRSIDPEQPDHLGYSPAVSGIALNFNRVHFQWKRAAKGWTVTMDARTVNYRPEVATATMEIADRKVPVYTYAETARVEKWTVARAALGKGGSRWLPVRKPALYAGDVFRTLARSHGIVLGRARVSRSPPAGEVLVAHRSGPLGPMLRNMLKHSNNLTAEMVGMAATTRRGAMPADLKGSAAAMNRWAAERLGMKDPAMVDHSGLGDASRMSAEDMVSALVRAEMSGPLRDMLKSFPMRDADGRENKAHPIKVRAKTGTLNFVSGLGGYMTAVDGTELAFAIFTADTGRRARLSRAERERPAGARSWNLRSRKLQQALIERWGAVYGS